ncbi:MAG: hypothetical protein M1374_07735 [Firmicutes bacterium]|nr:hypothetical protein [Bacillota bacterium]
MVSRWAEGLQPRNLTWIIPELLAVSERPGGHHETHRAIRQREEIVWLKANKFIHVVSLLSTADNITAYTESKIAWYHAPITSDRAGNQVLVELYENLDKWIRQGERTIMHEGMLGDVAFGAAAGFLCWEKIYYPATKAIFQMERMTKRHLGASGRQIVATTALLVDERETKLKNTKISEDESSDSAPDVS